MTKHYEFPIGSFQSIPCTKQQLAERMKLSDRFRAFDYALPQMWLDAFNKAHSFTYDQILSSTFWCYGKGDTFGTPVSGCTEIQQAIVEYMKG